MSIKYTDKFLDNDARVTATLMGDIVELQYMENVNRQAKIRKIDKYTYEVLKTGEIRHFNLSENRKDNVNSLRQTFKRLAYLVNANFSGNKNEFWITLTYAEKQYDYKKVSKDYDRFLKRLRYRYSEWGELEAIKVLEPHADSSWHIHMLLKFPALKTAYIANEDLAKIWRNGFVTIDHIQQTDNVGAYLTAYLSDMSLEEAGVVYSLDDNGSLLLNDNNENIENLEEIFSKDGVTGLEMTKSDSRKAVIKGGRLSFYPVNMKIYTTTKGIRKPERIESEYGYAKELFDLKNENLTLRRSLKIEDDENQYSNTIVIEQYNRKVKKNSVLVELEEYKKELARYNSGKLAKDWWFSVLEEKIYELENRFSILEQTREFNDENKKRN